MEILRRNIDAVHVLAGALLVTLIGCDVPSDPNHTLNQVRVKAMRVGISDNPPWTCVGTEGMAGIEVRLVREFAEQQGTETRTPT